MAFINDGDALPASKTNKNPLPTGADPNQYIAASDHNAHRQALLDTQTFLRGNFKFFDNAGANPIGFYNVSGTPNAVVTAAKGSLAVDRTNAAVYQNTDGATAWTKIGATTGSISLVAETAGDFDFNTLGTFDWTYAEPWGTAKDHMHGKATGGFLRDTFDFRMTEGASAVDTRTWLIHAASSDDMDVLGIHNVGDTLGVTRNMNGFNGTGALYSGFTFRIPCSPNPRTLRWQGTGFNVQTIASAQFSDPAIGTTQTLHFDTAVSSGMNYRAAVTFSGPYGSWLIVTHYVSNILTGGGGNLYVGPIACA